MHLFEPLVLRSLTVKNRIFLAPMCQYQAAPDGRANDWHRVHLGARAVGGAGLVMVEATAVVPEGRISAGDLGLWEDGHVEALLPITRFVRDQGAVAAIQLAHAGRKASTPRAWETTVDPTHAWQPVGPSTEPFSPTSPVPRSLTREEIAKIPGEFAAAAKRALAAGFQIVEVHAAHGYLLHQFLSPVTNTRTDVYGGSLENRMRLACEVLEAVRAVWPQELPLFLRVSATDWLAESEDALDGSWTLAQTVQFARKAKALGVDLIDCSSGGLVPHAKIPAAPHFQVPFAARVKREAEIATAAVGLITEPTPANAILEAGDADAISLGRVLLREPHWPLYAARSLGKSVPWPHSYLRGAP